jgi:hypothetical protein
VFVVGSPPGSWPKHALVTSCDSISDAVERIYDYHRRWREGRA